MPIGDFEDRSQNVARELLSAAAVCLADPHLVEHIQPARAEVDQPSDLRGAARRLLGVLSGSLKGDSNSLGTARRLVTAAATTRHLPALRLTAANDYLYRTLSEYGDERLREFVLAQNQQRLETPELISALLKRFKVPAKSPLAEANVLACRHLMGSTVAELHAIQALFPDMKIFEVMGKPYSANRLAVDALRNLDIEVNIESCDIPALRDQPLGTYAARHKRIARSVVDRYIRKYGDTGIPLVVIDDGGALINAVGRKVLTGEIRSPIVAIEQTTHGLFAIQEFLFHPKAQASGFALISVADSRAKLDQESQLIADSVMSCVDQWLALLRAIGLPGEPLASSSQRVGIIGFGPVGATIAKDLALRSKVTIHDRNRRKLILAKSFDLDVAWSVEELFSRSDIVLAASGGTSIDAETTAYLQDGTILISASSGDLEFSGLSELSGWTIETQPVLPTAGHTPFDSSHGLLVARHKDGRTVYVLNRGFPVNFDGSHDPIPVEDIQITRALVVGAVLQAAGAPDGASLVGETAKFGLDETIDDFVGEEFRKLRSERNLAVAVG